MFHSQVSSNQLHLVTREFYMCICACVLVKCTYTINTIAITVL